MTWFGAWARHQIEQGPFTETCTLVDTEAPALVVNEVRFGLDAEDLPADPALARLVQRLRHAWWVCRAFPLAAGGAAVTARPLDDWGWQGGLLGAVSVSRGDGAVTLVVAPEYVLDSDPASFRLRFDAWRAQCDAALRGRRPRPQDFVFDPPGRRPTDDPRWDAFTATFGDALTPASVAARVRASAAWADARFERVSARFREVYRLPLPRWIADLAALADALGSLPQGPPASLWGSPAGGWERGWSWLDGAVQMRAFGLLSWFEADGMQRPTRSDGDGVPLDPRLDCRFRCDAPQFVTFASGDSDGLHWGLWYDSPEHAPRIAYNWARDSAETACSPAGNLLVFLAQRLDEQRTALREEDADAGRQEPAVYLHTLLSRRMLRVVALHLEALRALASDRPDLAPCPWRRSSANPVGSPQLALPPRRGTLSTGGPHTGSVQRSATALRGAIASARADLEGGRPVSAYALGLTLHWLDDDDLRQEAASLLEDAYRALGWEPFAEILRVHVRHRDLPSVAVFDEAPWPPALPTQDQRRAASEPVQVAWDHVAQQIERQEAPDRAAAHARARRLGLDWDEPVQRAIATWSSDADEGALARLLG